VAATGTRDLVTQITQRCCLLLMQLAKNLIFPFSQDPDRVRDFIQLSSSKLLYFQFVSSSQKQLQGGVMHFS